MKVLSKFQNCWLTIVVIGLIGCSHVPVESLVEQDTASIDPTHPPALVELNFESHGKRLNGILYQANGAGPHPTVVLLHGYPGNEKNLDIAQSLRRSGFNVLFFHYRGAWGSGGDFSFSNVIEDVASALDFLRTKNTELRVDENHLLLIGHSMGGFAALQGAARDDAVKCVAGIAPADVGVIAKLAQTDADFADSFASGAADLTMLKGWDGQALLNDLQAHADDFDLAALAPRLSGKSVLLVAGDKDAVIAPDTFHAPMVAAYRAQADITLTHKIISGDHSFSWSRLELIDLVLNWAQACEAKS